MRTPMGVFLCGNIAISSQWKIQYQDSGKPNSPSLLRFLINILHILWIKDEKHLQFEVVWSYLIGKQL